MYRIYKYVLGIDNSILYVGKTIQDIEDRINQHLKSGDNICEDGWYELSLCDIYYVDFNKESDMNKFEEVMINTYQPKYNKAYKKSDCVILPSLDYDLHWKKLNIKRESYISLETNLEQCRNLYNFDKDNPKSFDQILDEYKDGKSINYYSLAFDIDGKMICRKRLYTANDSLRFDFYLKNRPEETNKPDELRGIFYINRSDKKKLNDRVAKAWKTRGNTLYYRVFD